MANKFYDKFLALVEKIFIDRIQFSINSFSGLKGRTLQPREGVGIIIKKDNLVIIGSGEDEKKLEEVMKWFIEKYGF